MNKTYTSLQNQKGFTLIELLVVIAIIALLISLLIPVTSKALESSRRAACASNLRSLVQGLVVYASDHKGEFPYYRSDSNSWPWGASWAVRYSNFYEDYVNTDRTYFCPTDMSNSSLPSEALRARPYFPTSYGPRPAWRRNISYNYFMGTEHSKPSWENGRGGYKNIGDIPDPSSCTMIADLMKLVRGSYPTTVDIPVDKDWNHRKSSMAKSGGNLGYADGHVEWFSLKFGLPDEYITRSRGNWYVNHQSDPKFH